MVDERTALAALISHRTMCSECRPPDVAVNFSDLCGSGQALAVALALADDEFEVIDRRN